VTLSTQALHQAASLNEEAFLRFGIDQNGMSFTVHSMIFSI